MVKVLVKNFRPKIESFTAISLNLFIFLNLIQKDFNFTNEPHQSLLLEIIETFSNNLKIQESLLKLIESSLHLTVSQKNNNGLLDLKLLQKFIYIFIVNTVLRNNLKIS